uniref:Uncharacterized protein n=1 Tax=uncultured prokaryote TaxID=198431 RepID=A0A0H5QNP7_9ZZZZ|nr:hypothetical protein [uncultured prokaryote]
MPTLVQVTIKTADAIPENFITNNFAVTGDVDSPTDSADLMAAFQTFYGTVKTACFPVTVAQNAHEFKLYIAGGPRPNYPLYENVFNLTGPGSGDTLPSEVALCLSFAGVRIPGLPQARRRGRVYLGPLKATNNVLGRPSSSVITAILAAAQTLKDDIDDIPSAGSWAVWSPTSGTAVSLTDAWMDNAWDTQRSRGLIRTLKTMEPLVP